jgi:hypothetical protein
MTQIFSEPGNTTHELIKETIEDPELDFQQAKDASKKLALTKCKNCMLLSWKNGKTGEFYPTRMVRRYQLVASYLYDRNSC